MKDVKFCSISSVAFNLEVDAYDTLSGYIESIRSRYIDNPDGEEIIADIEARIAELILAVHGADRVVSKPLIDNIIAQMGSADDICDQCPEGEPAPAEPAKKPRRRLYRNVDDSSIGGVCSGVATFIGCNITLVRLIALLLVFFGGASFWIYVILWLVLPAATTARQKLEMRGEPITASSIRDFYNNIATAEERRTAMGSVMGFVGRVMMVIFKIILICVIVALIVSLVGVIIGLFAMVVTCNWDENILVASMALMSVAVLLALGIYSLMQVVNSRRVSGKTLLAIVILWMVVSIGAASATLIFNDSIKDKVETLGTNMRSIRIEVVEDCD
ncbi:MAG: PspC domain-containing protein [Rikenellaceae bacterium]